MHDSHQLDDIVEEHDTNPPDRQQFENSLENYHSALDKIKREIHVRCKKCVDSNPRKMEMKSQSKVFRDDLQALRMTSDKLKTQMDVKRREQLDMEKDCRIRNRDQLTKMLGELEKRYNTKNLSGRDEQTLVTEIDGLKRNRAKLDALDEVIAERKSLDVKLEETKKERNKVYTDFTTLNKELKLYQDDRRRIENEIIGYRSEMQKMKEERQNLIDMYDHNRKEYKTWLSENHNGTSVPMSFPSAAKKNKKIVDYEELEPYFEQKRDCRRLINYLEHLKNNVQEEVNKQVEVLKIDSDDDSADELPPQLIKNNTRAPAPVPLPNHRRNLKKGTQPISHNIDIYKLFGTVDVEVPTLYSEVTAALTAVRAKLAFYDQQTTNELDWGEDWAGFELSSISRTVSEMDSLMEDSLSEVGSVSSSYHRASSRASCQSPLAADTSPKRVVSQEPKPSELE